MKATIEFDDGLYRRLKIEAARRGTTIRELVDEGVRTVLSTPTRPPAQAEESDWFGSLRTYARNAGGKHDLAAIRKSIAKKRTR